MSLSPIYSPFTHYEECGHQPDVLEGITLLESGKIGCLVVAGGQGTRLGFKGPKGKFPITPVTHKSLFQLLAEKTAAAGRIIGVPLSLAIMTSPENDQETRDHFIENHYFSLDPANVDFFVQNERPLCYENGEPAIDDKGQTQMGADGNGMALHLFFKSHIWEKWNHKGISYVNFILIDNPLADPWDVELAGFQKRKQVDVVIKCVERTDPKENVGLIVQGEEGVRVIEYTELSPEEKLATDSSGKLKYRLANISLFSFTMDFIKNIAETALPFHKAHKVCDKLPGSPVLVKLETFIFDILPFTQSIGVLKYPRNLCFAPLKNGSGPDSPETVQQALQQYDIDLYVKQTGLPPPDGPFELNLDNHYSYLKEERV